MLQNPATKYHAFAPIRLVDRNWPSRVIDRPPVWMSTDLRDGNQALFEPMNGEKKMRMFKTLCEHPGGNVGDRGRPGARPALISGSVWSQSSS